MKTGKVKYLLFVVLTIASTVGFAQEFNYQMSGIGSRSSMLSGAVTAGVRDNSAIFYNPAGLGYIKNSSLSVSSDGYYLGMLDVENGAGTDLNLNSSTVDGFSQIFSVIQKIPDLPISLTLGILSRHYTNIKTSERTEMPYDVLSSNAGDEYYVGTYRYYNKIKETWVGFGYGKEVKPNLSFGISTFITYRNQEYFRAQSADVYPNIENPSLELLANTYIEEELTYDNFGWLFILGANWQIKDFKIGLAITTPRINLGFISKSSFKRSLHVSNEVSDTINIKASVWRSKVKSTFKSPLIADIGFEYPLTKNMLLHGKISLSSRVKKYDLLSGTNVTDDIPDYLPGEYKGYTNMMLANKPVLNFSIAFQRHFSDKIEYILGFRTDFNYLDKNEIDVYDGNYPGLAYWDIYHVTTGIIWGFEKFDLSIGGGWAFGRERDIKQFVNLTEPTDEYFLFGIPNESARTLYNEFSISLGFTYFFKRI